MPAAAPAIAAASTFLSSPIGIALLLGGVAVLSYLTRSGEDANPTDPETRKASGAKLSQRIGEDTYVDAIYGLAATEGQYVGHQVYGANNRYLKLMFILGTGWHDSLDALYVGGVKRTLGGSNSGEHGWSVNDFEAPPESDPEGDDVNHMWVKFYPGSPTQTADPKLVEEGGTIWTADHKFTSQCYAIVTLRYNKNTMSSIPSLLFGVKGLRLYDFRKDSTQDGGSGSHRWNNPATWEWTDNPAVCLWNYKRGLWLNGLLVLGEGLSELDLRLDYFVAAANLSDEDVTFPETGNTLDRYSVGLVVSDDMDRGSTCRIFEAAMGGYGMDSGGRYGPVPAAAGLPVATITDEHLALGYKRQAQRRLLPTQTFTAVQGTFRNPDNGWENTPYGLLSDSSVDTAEGGRRTRSATFGYVRFYETSRMLAEIQRRRDRYTAYEQLVVHPRFVRLEPGDLVTRTTPLFGGSIVMTVESREELADGNVALTLREWNNAVVPSSYGFVTLPPTAGDLIPAPDLTSTLIGFDITAVQLVADDSHLRTGIKVVWDAIDDQSVRRVVIRFWPATLTEADAQTHTVEVAPGVQSTVLQGLLPLTLYRVKATIVTDPDRATYWTAEKTVTTFNETFSIEEGSITNLELAKQWRDALQWVVDDGPGTLVERIERGMRKLAANVADNIMTADRDIREVAQVAGQASAAVRDELLAAIDPNGSSALAQAIRAIAAESASGLAEGLFTVQAYSGNPEDVPPGFPVIAVPEYAAVRLALVGRVSNTDDYEDAGMYIDIIPVVGGGHRSSISFKADSINFVQDGASPQDPAFVYENGQLTLAVARIREIRAGILRNASGSSVINLTTGSIRLATGA